jgi:two-component system OmpR family sensor kinase
MKNLSVTTFIHILFTLVIAILVATFMLFLSWDRDRQKIDEFKRYQLISLTFLSNLQLSPDREDLKALYTKLHLKPVYKKRVASIKKKIENGGETIFNGGSKLGQVRVFNIDGTHYIYIQRMSYNLMLRDNRPKSYFFETVVLAGFFLTLLLLLLYLAVLRKLSPLKTLYKEIQRFAKGDMQVRIGYNNEDEIGKIAKSFDDAIMHIRTLSHSKNLFMRNMMHELKTPITKGRIVVEMLEDEASKKILIRAFERMNELISELAEIERITTYGFEPTFEYLLLSELVEESKEILLGSADLVEVEIKDQPFMTDKKLMVLVLKNLLDNGIKYSQDNHVKLLTNHEGVIEIHSKGQPLQKPLSYYIEPFSQEEKRSAGFGLGLYIVDSILSKLGYWLDYRYEKEEGTNIFSIRKERRKVKRT